MGWTWEEIHEWRHRVGDDLQGSDWKLCFVSDETRSNWVSEFPEGPHVDTPTTVTTEGE